MSQTHSQSDRLAVDIRDLWFSYDTTPVLRDVNLAISPGEKVCMVGPNGGGKTTLVKLILGLLRPTQGQVRILGGPPATKRKRIGYAPQHAVFDPKFPVSVTDVVRMGRLGHTGVIGPYRRDDKIEAAAALEAVGLSDLSKRPFSDLSGGQRQRVLIARAIASNPELLLMDEPTANLDIGVETEFHHLLERLSEKLTLVMVSHDVGFVSQLVDKVVCVHGSVAVHPTAELTGELMNDLYGHDIMLVRHDHNCQDHSHPTERHDG
ncbi:MAG: ABC transporter ATP-binding protein [Phycisphaerales bacterium]|jgi:zinc transport system ATP-binding protein|nr:ABC transporter ATP-binding protein [Phycisphaerales bacterium]